MTFDTLSPGGADRSVLQAVENPYRFCNRRDRCKIEFAESGPSLQDTLTDFLLRQKAGCNFGYGPLLLRDKVSRGGGILVVPPGQRYNIDVM